MTFNLDTYRIHLEPLKQTVDAHDSTNRMYWISFYSAVSGCPIIACLYYASEIYGMNDKIRSNLDSVLRLYNIEEVVGIR